MINLLHRKKKMEWFKPQKFTQTLYLLLKTKKKFLYTPIFHLHLFLLQFCFFFKSKHVIILHLQMKQLQSLDCPYYDDYSLDAFSNVCHSVVVCLPTLHTYMWTRNKICKSINMVDLCIFVIQKIIILLCFSYSVVLTTIKNTIK